MMSSGEKDASIASTVINGVIHKKCGFNFPFPFFLGLSIMFPKIGVIIRLSIETATVIIVACIASTP